MKNIMKTALILGGGGFIGGQPHQLKALTEGATIFEISKNIIKKMVIEF